MSAVKFSLLWQQLKIRYLRRAHSRLGGPGGRQVAVVHPVHTKLHSVSKRARVRRRVARNARNATGPPTFPDDDHGPLSVPEYLRSPSSRFFTTRRARHSSLHSKSRAKFGTSIDAPSCIKRDVLHIRA